MCIRDSGNIKDALPFLRIVQVQRRAICAIGKFFSQIPVSYTHLDVYKRQCLARPGKRMQAGTKVEFGDGSLTAVVDETLPDGNKYVTFTYDTETCLLYTSTHQLVRAGLFRRRGQLFGHGPATG